MSSPASNVEVVAKSIRRGRRPRSTVPSALRQRSPDLSLVGERRTADRIASATRTRRVNPPRRENPPSPHFSQAPLRERWDRRGYKAHEPGAAGMVTHVEERRATQ